MISEWDAIDKKDIIAYLKCFDLSFDNVKDIIDYDFKQLHLLSYYIRNGLPQYSTNEEEKWETLDKSDLVEVLLVNGIYYEHVRRWVRNDYNWNLSLYKYFIDENIYDLIKFYKEEGEIDFKQYSDCGAPENKFQDFVRHERKKYLSRFVGNVESN